jgi:hypothetical protein
MFSKAETLIIRDGLDPRLHRGNQWKLFLGAGSYLASSPSVIKMFGQPALPQPQTYEHFEKMLLCGLATEGKPFPFISSNFILTKEDVSYDPKSTTHTCKHEWFTTFGCSVLPGDPFFIDYPSETSAKLQRPPSKFDSTLCQAGKNQELNYICSYNIDQVLPIVLYVYRKL